MYDNYIYTVRSGDSFLAGYSHCTLTESTNPAFLFSTLRIIRVLDGDADWRIGNNIHFIQKGDIIAVNNIDIR